MSNLSVLLPDPLSWVAPTSQITISLNWKTVSRSPSRSSESGRLRSQRQNSKMMELVEEQGGEWKELEGIKDESKLIKYLQHDQRMRMWAEKKKGWILSRCIWKVFAIKVNGLGLTQQNMTRCNWQRLSRDSKNRWVTGRISKQCNILDSSNLSKKDKSTVAWLSLLSEEHRFLNCSGRNPSFVLYQATCQVCSLLAPSCTYHLW